MRLSVVVSTSRQVAPPFIDTVPRPVAPFVNVSPKVSGVPDAVVDVPVVPGLIVQPRLPVVEKNRLPEPLNERIEWGVTRKSALMLTVVRALFCGPSVSAYCCR